MHPNSESPYRALSETGAPAAACSVAGDVKNEPLTVPREPQSREDAYRQLASIAEYLARYEPHSPVPYLIQRALEWGGKPLPVLLRELTSGDADGQRLWSFLGLLPVETDPQ